MIHWPQTITYKINPGINYPADAIRDALSLWENVADVDFVEIQEPVAIFLFTAIEDVLTAFDIPDTVDGIAVWQHNNNVGVHAYFGLDQDRIEATSLVRVAAHEAGHAFGIFPDRPSASPGDTIYSYHPSPNANLEADDIEAIQAALGASPNDNVIRAGHGSGTVSGGAGDDLIYGNRGEDIVYGNQDDDTLYGGQGRDLIYGGQGDDLIIGNQGDDTMAGNLGADVFDLRGGGADTILDFGAGDRIAADGVTATAGDGGVVLSHAAGTVMLAGVADWSDGWLV